MTSADPQFEALLGYIKEARGFDFTGYKRASLMRRFNRRMVEVGVEDYGDYLDFLQVHQHEFAALFNTILINVTGFFRDPDAWQQLRTEMLEPLVREKPADDPIRVWSAGCASGEEAYTAAIVLAEILGHEDFTRRVKIYATDVDDEGLSDARQAVYGERDVRDVPPPLRDRYFESAGDRYSFRKDLRRSVIFGRNDLVQDAPISRIDLLICRNTLMYFNAETQSRILSRFHFALGDDGVLFLGKAEMLLSQGALFLPVDLKRRIFWKVPRAMALNGPMTTEASPPSTRRDLVGLDQLRNEALMTSPGAQIIVTSDGLVALANRQAEAMFGVSPQDVGRPFRDLEVSYRPVELRNSIERAQVERRVQRLGEIEFHPPGGEVAHLEIQLNPLMDSDSRLLGVALLFNDVTAAHDLQQELALTNRQLETAYEELQSTNEELETTNEELQSTVEELETTNEELQSTNEELETMNEELHSTNDELQSINEQLHQSTDKLDATNAFLEAVLTSLRAGVAVVGPDLQVQEWNRRAEDLWGLRRDEAVGQHFLNLDIGLPTESMRPLFRQALNDGGETRELSVAAVNRRGRTIQVRVVCTPLAVNGGPVAGAILVMDEEAGP
jgi:two-component system, chemotaxis family, CheB/CheR fusion protein